MPEFSARPKELKQQAEALVQTRRRLMEATMEVGRITSALRTLSCLDDQRARLDICSRQLDRQTQALERMGQALHEIAGLYEGTEYRSQCSVDPPGTAESFNGGNAFVEPVLPGWNVSWRQDELILLDFRPCPMLKQDVTDLFRR